MKPSVIATNTQLFPGVMLRCEFPDSDSSMTFEWTINGRPMYPDDSFNISFTQNSTTLNIFRLSGVVYDLVYTCAVISVEDGRVITEANFIWTDMFSDQCRENLPPLCTKYGWSAYVPSYLSPQNIDDAALQLHLFFPLVKIGCSAALHPFLCHLYAPPCSDALRLPCRSLCLEARQGCDPVMTKFGYNWPVLFDCMTFPEDNCWSSYNNLTGEPVVSKSHEPMLTTNVPTTIAMSTETQEQSTEVNRPPGIFIQPEKDVYFNPNVTVQLPCVATGFPKPTYKWKFNGWDLNPNGQDDRVVQLPDEGTIEINAPGNKDEGLYQCFADNGYGVSVSIKSHLREAELGNFVFEDSRTHILYIVDSLMLPCTTPTSYPTPDVYWVFRDRDGLWKPLNYGKRITMDLEGPTVSTSKSNATYTMMSAATTNMPLAEVSGFCVENQIPMCKDLGYNSIFLPNNLNQTIEDVGLGLSEFGPLVAARCSRALKPFLCYKFAPPCTEPRSPCRRLCEEARMGCEPLMKKFGFRWPDHLGCTSLPEKDCLSQYPNDNGYPSTSDNSTHLFDLFDKLQRQPSNTSYSFTTKITSRTTQMPQTKVESMRSGGVILIRSNSSVYIRDYAFGNRKYKPVTTDLYINPRNFDMVRMEGLQTDPRDCPLDMTECYIMEFRRFSGSESQSYTEIALAFSHVDEFNNAKNQL